MFLQPIFCEATKNLPHESSLFFPRSFLSGFNLSFKLAVVDHQQVNDVALRPAMETFELPLKNKLATHIRNINDPLAQVSINTFEVLLFARDAT